MFMPSLPARWIATVLGRNSTPHIVSGSFRSIHGKTAIAALFMVLLAGAVASPAMYHAGSTLQNPALALRLWNLAEKLVLCLDLRPERGREFYKPSVDSGIDVA